MNLDHQVQKDLEKLILGFVIVFGLLAFGMFATVGYTAYKTLKGCNFELPFCVRQAVMPDSHPPTK